MSIAHLVDQKKMLFFGNKLVSQKVVC